MSEQERYLDELKQFLRIPSISTDPQHKQDIRRAAGFVEAQLTAAGMHNVGLIDDVGHPLVYGEWLEAPGKPTLLLYGHYDVQPVEPLDEWHSPPFEPEVRGDNIYARGAADDKGLTLILIKAVESVMKEDGRLPVNVRCLIEGEEECGGEHIERYVKSRPPQIKADAAVICDTEMFAPELPTICIGLRGIVYGELHVQGAQQDLHSGTYGGAAPNAIQAAAEIICALKDQNGHIHIPGFYDRVAQPSPEESAAWKRLPFDEQNFLRNEMRASNFTGEPEYSVFERISSRPTFEVHGIRGGFTGEGAKTVIPARAVAKISMRLVNDQEPEEVVRQVKAAVASVCPKGATAEFKVIHTARPSLVNPNNVYIQKAAAAMTQVFGNETVFTRGGGSIPIVSVFDQYLGIPSVMMGFGLPDDNLHAPNEKLFLPNFFRGIDAVKLYLRMLGQQ